MGNARLVNLHDPILRNMFLFFGMWLTTVAFWCSIPVHPSSEATAVLVWLSQGGHRSEICSDSRRNTSDGADNVWNILAWAADSSKGAGLNLSRDKCVHIVEENKNSVCTVLRSDSDKSWQWTTA